MDRGYAPSNVSAADLAAIYGPAVTAEIELKLHEYFTCGRSSLRSRELQQIIGWVLGEEVSPKWIFVKNKPLIQQCVLIVIDGITAERARGEDRQEIERIFKTWQQPSPQPVPLYTSHSSFNRSSVLADYLSCPIVRDKEKEKQEAKRKKQRLMDGSALELDVEDEEEEDAAPHPMAHLRQCILTPEELIVNHYPTPEHPNEFKRTCDYWNCTLRAPSDGTPQMPAAAASDATDPSSQVAELSADWLALPCVHAIPPKTIAADESNTKADDAVASECEEKAASSAIEPPKEPTSDAVLEAMPDAESTTAAALTSETDSPPSPPPTPPAAPTGVASRAPRLFGVDCEMCYTAVGLELTRATLLDDHGEVLVDRLVKPPRPIVDYNTRYSGMTPAMLADVTTTLEDVRIAFAEHLGSRDILVGHSLENDLKALKMIHRNVIDSAVLYTHPRGPPFKNSLRYLALKHLGRTIQTGADGHDSQEDALAALDLARIKLQFGRKFGEPQAERESIARVLNRCHKHCSLIGPSDSIADLIHDEPLYSAIVTPTSGVPAAVAKECANTRTHLVIGVIDTLREASKTRNNRNNNDDNANGAVAVAVTPAPAAATELTSEPSNSPSAVPSVAPLNSTIAPPPRAESPFASIEAALTTILAAARPNTLLLVASGQGLGAAQAGGENNKQGLLWMKIVNKTG